MIQFTIYLYIDYLIAFGVEDTQYAILYIIPLTKRLLQNLPFKSKKRFS